MALGILYFSPDGGAEQQIVSVIETFSAEILIMTHQWQSGPLQTAVLGMLAAEYPVRMIIDRRQQFIADPDVAAIRAAGGEVRFDKKHPAMHAQFVLGSDGWMAIGSITYTNPAEHTVADYVLICHDYDTEASLKAFFEEHWAHSVEV